jgi:hypothetical protein
MNPWRQEAVLKQYKFRFFTTLNIRRKTSKDLEFNTVYTY